MSGVLVQHCHTWALLTCIIWHAIGEHSAHTQWYSIQCGHIEPPLHWVQYQYQYRTPNSLTLYQLHYMDSYWYVAHSINTDVKLFEVDCFRTRNVWYRLYYVLVTHPTLHTHTDHNLDTSNINFEHFLDTHNIGQTRERTVAPIKLKHIFDMYKTALSSLSRL